MFTMNDTSPAAQQCSSGEQIAGQDWSPAKKEDAMDGQASQTLLKANPLKKGQRHHVQD